MTIPRWTIGTRLSESGYIANANNISLDGQAFMQVYELPMHCSLEQIRDWAKRRPENQDRLDRLEQVVKDLNEVEELRSLLANALRWIEVKQAYSDLGTASVAQVEARILENRRFEGYKQVTGHHAGWDFAVLPLERIRELTKDVKLPEHIEMKRIEGIQLAKKERLL